MTYDQCLILNHSNSHTENNGFSVAFESKGNFEVFRAASIASKEHRTSHLLRWYVDEDAVTAIPHDCYSTPVTCIRATHSNWQSCFSRAWLPTVGYEILIAVIWMNPTSPRTIFSYVSWKLLPYLTFCVTPCWGGLEGVAYQFTSYARVCFCSVDIFRKTVHWLRIWLVLKIGAHLSWWVINKRAFRKLNRESDDFRFTVVFLQ